MVPLFFVGRVFGCSGVAGRLGGSMINDQLVGRSVVWVAGGWPGCSAVWVVLAESRPFGLPGGLSVCHRVARPVGVARRSVRRAVWVAGRLGGSMINDQLIGRVLTGSLAVRPLGPSGWPVVRPVGLSGPVGGHAFTALDVDWYLMDASLQNRHYHITY